MKNALALLLAVASSSPVLAATFTVSNLADSGPGSLRAAILGANSAAGADEVVFTVAGTITLASGEIPISDPLAVNGPGAGSLTVSGNDQSRIFFIWSTAVAPIDVTLSGLTLTRGRTFAGGGAVAALEENLTILNSVISDSRATIAPDPPSEDCGSGNVSVQGGALRIVNSRVTGGTAEGFGIARGGNLCVIGSLNLERTTVSGGAAPEGGGLFFSGSTATILSSTISGNTAELDGGGVYAGSGELLALNSTISGNTAGGDGGGIFNLGASVALQFATVSNNTAAGIGGSLHSDGENGSFFLGQSILANGSPHDMQLSPDFYLASYSLIEDPGGLPVPGSNNLVGIDPLLGPLANNGGPTLTHLPLSGSPAIDSGNPILDPPPTDQRGFPRVAGEGIDRGSVEAQGFVVEVPTLSEWSLLVLSALLVAAGILKLRSF